MKKIFLIIAAVSTLLCMACNQDHLKDTEWERTVNYVNKEYGSERDYRLSHVLYLDGKTTGTVSEELLWIGGATQVADSTASPDSLMHADTVSLTYHYDADEQFGTINWQGDIWHFTVDGSTLTLQDDVANLAGDSIPASFTAR